VSQLVKKLKLSSYGEPRQNNVYDVYKPTLSLHLYLYPAGSPAAIHVGGPLRPYKSVAEAPPQPLLLRREAPAPGPREGTPGNRGGSGRALGAREAQNPENPGFWPKIPKKAVFGPFPGILRKTPFSGLRGGLREGLM